MTDWETIAQRSNGHYEAADFERACYRLITEQVIYRSDHAGATAYWLISDHERAIRDALDLVGVDLTVNRIHQFAVAQPRHAGATVVTTDETLIALVLRRYYDDQMRLGSATDNGEVVCELEEFGELYRQMTQRELPGKGPFAAVFRNLRRWGIAREYEKEGETSGTGGVIAIRPAIVEILGESALTRLASLATTRASANAAGADSEADKPKETDDEA